MKNIKNVKNIKGLSLIEILIVITVFSVISVLVTRSVVITLKGAKKSESQIKVRENLNYALSVMERQIRNSKQIITPDNCTGAGVETTQITFTTDDDLMGEFTIYPSTTNGYIASGSASPQRLTSDEIIVTEGFFKCIQTSPSRPPVIKIDLTAEDKLLKGVEGASVQIQTEISLRNF